ncbi:hypothetical protein WN51_11666 [Melipona quadrifasciata]|uniref:Uncharacterized protein n=1 Tax=Melipona quadrifasciata TaxID=166423 RepID=A0A0M9A376_9HYME|nr:hypothetical protein WN51_11666 [Melipona quadrifasciata]
MEKVSTPDMVTSGVGSGSARGTRRRTSSTSADSVDGSGGVPRSQLLAMASAQAGVATPLANERQRIDITGQWYGHANPFRIDPRRGFVPRAAIFAITKCYAGNANRVTILTLTSGLSLLTRSPIGLLMQPLACNLAPVMSVPCLGSVGLLFGILWFCIGLGGVGSLFIKS